MRLDHVSYVTSHDQLSDTVQRLGAILGGTFVDGGIHPRFGTRNFILPLKDHRYLEVVCPLDHPAVDNNAFGKVVTRRANEGGGWMTWVLATGNLEAVETRLGRKAAEGRRTKPDGKELKWLQIGVTEVFDDRQRPFFIKWLTESHPSEDAPAFAKITKVDFAGDKEMLKEYVGEDAGKAIEGIEINWLPKTAEGDTGIIAVYFDTPHGEVKID